jgi:hypothetical protein
MIGTIIVTSPMPMDPRQLLPARPVEFLLLLAPGNIYRDLKRLVADGFAQ